MNDSDLVSAPARVLRQHIASGEISCVEFSEALISHIEAANPSLNAVVRFDPEFVRDQARAADRRHAEGDRSAWLGIPFTVKENIWIAGRPASTGSMLFRDFTAPTDAIAVARLRAAGAIVVGSTNCSEFACKGVTTNPLHGTTRNPWDLSRTPGGSSGGAAAATSAGIGHIALGTDAGGSVRRPAAHTGLIGFKPSPGLVPHVGGFDEPVYGNSQIGVLARCVADVADTLSLIGTPHADDPQCPPMGFFDRLQVNTGAVQRARIAYSPRLGLGFAVDRDIGESVRVMADQLRAQGHIVEEIDPPWPAGTSEDALLPLQFAGLAAIYGERWRRDPWVADLDIARQIETGLSIDGRTVAAALELRKHLRAALQRLFADHDFILTPTTAATAWPLEFAGPPEIEGRPASQRGHAVFTGVFNHTYVPACSVPCGLDRSGLPIGLQIVGPQFADARVLSLAAQVESLCEYDFTRIHLPS